MTKISAIMIKLKDGRLGLVPSNQPKGIPDGKVVVELCDSSWIRTGEKILSSHKGAERIGFID